MSKIDTLRAEVERLKKVIAKELSENDVNVLRAENLKFREVIEKMRQLHQFWTNGGKASVIYEEMGEALKTNEENEND